MNRGEARDILRMILGDQSSSVWSDNELNGILIHSNRRISRRIAEENPGRAIFPQVVYVGPSAHRGDFSLMNASGLDAMYVVAIESLFYTTGSVGVASGAFAIAGGADAAAGLNMDVAWVQIPLRGTRELTEGSGNALIEPEIFNRLDQSPYTATFKRDIQTISIRPRPKEDFTILVEPVAYGQADLGTDIEGGETADDAMLLSGTNMSISEAVVFDAAYILTMKDQSLRQEFAAERERILGTSSLTAHTSAFAD